VEYADIIKFRVEALAFGTQSPVRAQIDTDNGGKNKEGVFIKLL